MKISVRPHMHSDNDTEMVGLWYSCSLSQPQKVTLFLSVVITVNFTEIMSARTAAFVPGVLAIEPASTGPGSEHQSSGPSLFY